MHFLHQWCSMSVRHCIHYIQLCFKCSVELYLLKAPFTRPGYNMWEQELVLKVRVEKRRGCSLETIWTSDLWCDLLPLCFALQKFPLARQRCILNWSTYLFMDERPNIIKLPPTQSESSLALSSSVKSSCHLNTVQLSFSPAAMLLLREELLVLVAVSQSTAGRSHCVLNTGEIISQTRLCDLSLE